MSKTEFTKKLSLTENQAKLSAFLYSLYASDIPSDAVAPRSLLSDTLAVNLSHVETLQKLATLAVQSFPDIEKLKNIDAEVVGFYTEFHIRGGVAVIPVTFLDELTLIPNGDEPVAHHATTNIKFDAIPWQAVLWRMAFNQLKTSTPDIEWKDDNKGRMRPAVKAPGLSAQWFNAHLGEMLFKILPGYYRLLPLVSAHDDEGWVCG
jgi:hypothetical protein